MSQTVIVQKPASNGLGIAGLIISLVGFLTCGLISPLGLLLSFCGLFKAPRGAAIAGTILGLIGSSWMAFFGLAFIMALVAPAVDTANQAAMKVAADEQGKSVVELSPPSVLPPLESPKTPEIVLPADPEPPKVEEPVEPIQPAETPEVVETVDFRTWTSGQFKLEAKFIKLEADKVTLEKRDGSAVEVPLESLGEEDQAWVKNRLDE